MNKRGWERRLPDGVHLQEHTSTGFTLGLTLPADEDGMLPLHCPVDHDHMFKMKVTFEGEADPAPLHCPYCGHTAEGEEFLADEMPRIRAATHAAAVQYAHQEIQSMLSNAFGNSKNVSYTPGRPPAVPVLPSYEVEPTRRSMECNSCGEVFAVYGLATYCPICGVFAPHQQFTQLLRVHRERLTSLDALAPEVLRGLVESGVAAATYASTFKDGFGALETYLKNRFLRDGGVLPKGTQPTVFQRLDDANALYQSQLSVDLAASAGETAWDALRRAAAVRHVLTHNDGVVDDKFLSRVPTWPQKSGERILVGRAAAVGFLDDLLVFSDAAIT